MKILFLRLLKLLVLIAMFFGRLLNRKEIDVLIIGNYEFMSSCQKEFILRLKKEKINYYFMYNIEKNNIIKKFVSYIKCSFYLVKSKNIIIYDYCFPIYLLKKNEEQKVYQLWHANGSFKKFGIPNFFKKYGNEYAKKLYNIVKIHTNYDYIFVSNEKCIEYYMKAFNDFDRNKYYISNNIMLDMLIEESHKFKKDKKNNKLSIILAPTYNYNPKENIYEKFVKGISGKKTKSGLEIECTPLLHPKLHPNYNKIDAMLNSDILITDYSSVCFEASGIDKEVVFFRSRETVDIFVDVAKKVYYEPEKLINDIIEEKIVDNHLNDFITENGDKQLDIVLNLIRGR